MLKFEDPYPLFAHNKMPLFLFVNIGPHMKEQ